MLAKPSLVVVGSGIKIISHITVEAKTYIEQSDLVLHLVNDPYLKDWIGTLNKNSQPLDNLYFDHELRCNSYDAIKDFIIEKLKLNIHLCVVFYGHPAVYSIPGIEAVKSAHKEGYYAKILPGISTEDCLFADLLIDPGSCGSQSFEATDFIIHERYFQTSSHLILYQIDAVGSLKHNHKKERTFLHLIIDYLATKYSLQHRVVIYEASKYPGFEPKIEEIALGKLEQTMLSPISTLYIPPNKQKTPQKILLEKIIKNN